MKSTRFTKSPTLSRFVTRLSAEIDAVEAGSEGAVDFIDFTAEGQALALQDILSYTNVHDDAHVALLADMMGILQDSPLAAALMRQLAKKGWHIGLRASASTQEEEGYVIDLAEKTLWLDHGGLSARALTSSVHCYHSLLGNLIRALRDAAHDARLNGYEVTLRPDAVLMLERVRCADVEAVLTMSAWELRSAGHPQLWRHLLGSEDGDIALSFGYMIEKTPPSLFNGQAMAAAFLRWYKDDMRLNACDHGTLEYLDELLSTCTEPLAWGRGSLCEDDVRDLSILPDGLAYLKAEAAEILQSPVYQTIPDLINEAHLFQVTYDAMSVTVSGVPFRSAALARKIFPTQH